ncbi:hypothetical protein VNO77_10881 [Canavalia gladiata]|uniref:Uncharacterized protein n=1 Tax=Canavalia gladiata TaxID=3824 RepID=A0AAN9R2C7_CANGL
MGKRPGRLRQAQILRQQCSANIDGSVALIVKNFGLPKIRLDTAMVLVCRLGAQYWTWWMVWQWGNDGWIGSSKLKAVGASPISPLIAPFPSFLT